MILNRAIVGYSGFVGSNLLQFYNFDKFYNSKNFHEATNMVFDEMFFCGVPAVKWYANKNPEEDNNTLNKIKDILHLWTFKTPIFIIVIINYNKIII